MRTFRGLLLILIVTCIASSQERVLLTPQGEVIPVGNSQSALELIKTSAAGAAQEPSPPPVCPGSVPIGVVPGSPTVNFGYNYGDVAAMIYTTPYAGVIESVYFMSYGSVAIPDSTASLSIMWANTTGLGATAWMGFWPDSNAISCDSIPISPFPAPYMSEATGPYIPGYVGYAPVAEERWGLGGYPVVWHTGTTITGVRMMDLGYEPTVTAGDSFGVCIRVPNCPNTGTNRNEMSGVSGSGQGRFFKFYHTQRLGTGDYGWYCRTDYDMYIWVVLRPTYNIPPIIEHVTRLHHTISQSARTVQAYGYDCNPGDPADTAIASMTLQYKIEGGPYIDVPMTVSNFVWSGDIPAGMPYDSTVYYKVLATDNHGLTSEYGFTWYRIVRLHRDGYTTTFPTYNFVDITSSGTQIQPNDFFPGGNYDDGTAGPFDLGGTFTYFNQALTTAWAGANGALGLSASATDTISVSDLGCYSCPWTIPQSGVPRNFISPFWNDLLIAPGGHGSIFHETIETRFIVEYYHVGNFNSASDTTTTFEVILDRADSSITFQYADVGTTGLDLSALVGFQSVHPDSGWVFLNRFGYPIETRPAANFAMKMKYTLIVSVPTEETRPTSFVLYPNYPNPFNPITVIRYSLPVGQNGILSYHVSLRIYNLLGQEVATLVNEVKQQGTYTVEWRAQGVSSGVYFYRLEVGKFSDMKKLILLK